MARIAAIKTKIIHHPEVVRLQDILLEILGFPSCRFPEERHSQNALLLAFAPVLMSVYVQATERG